LTEDEQLDGIEKLPERQPANNWLSALARQARERHEGTKNGKEKQSQRQSMDDSRGRTA